MAVVIETTLGDITVDLYLDQRPVTCLNFLKLCKMKYYNFNLFHTIRSGFIAQTGDPSGEGSGGESVWALLEGPEKRFFSGEKMPKIRHTDAGLLSMVCTGDMMVGSQFFFTLAPDLDSLDGVHCVIGEVTEGQDILRKLNDVICDETHRPYQDVRITHTVVLEDPFSDPIGLRAPSRSPSPSAERLRGGRIAPDEEIDETHGKSAAEVQEMIEEKEAKARATILEIVGDLPDADIAPPENVLFVCKLNPITGDEDLELIFSRFGKIVSCEVIRDKKTGDSLQYAFIEFADKKSCEEAYFKMDNILIDDRRIHVDFSQSVSKIKWLGKGRGVKHIKDNDSKDIYISREKSNRSRSRERGDRHSNNTNKDNYNNNTHNRQNHKHHDRLYRVTKESTNPRDKSERSRNRLERSRSRERLHVNKINHSDKKENLRDFEKRRNYHEHANRTDKNGKNSRYRESKKNSSRNHRSTSISPSRKNEDRASKKESNKYYDKYDRNNEKNTGKLSKNYNKEKENHNLKRKQYCDESQSTIKKVKYQLECEPRTPSPVTETKRTKNLNASEKVVRKEKKTIKKSRSVKKKRMPSTSSSDSDSSDSSSSSSDSSSSSENERKKKSRKKNKKYSSSSSSSDSSETSSSSSSSNTSSDSSTSSSDSDSKNRKKKKKTIKRKLIKKPKKKL